MSAQTERRTFLIVGSFAESLVNFRGPLIRAAVSRGYRVVACAPGGDDALRARLAELGAEFRSIRLERTGVNPLTDLRTLWDLFRLMTELKPDAMLAYTVKPVVYGSIAARLARVPGIHSLITGLGYAFVDTTRGGRLTRWLVRMLYRVALRFNRRVLFQNRDDLALFLSLGLIRSEVQAVVVNGSGVDVEHFSVQSLPPGPVFLLIARLLRDKGVREYVQAASSVRRLHPEARFLLAGWLDAGNPASISRAELDGWIAAKAVEYLGALDDVRPALAGCSVYVLPSYREGTPRTVLEAMAMGRPVITTDAPGCRQTVRDGDNGLLVPVMDPAALAGAMIRMIEEPGQREAMGRRGRTFAEDRYDARKVAGAMAAAMEL